MDTTAKFDGRAENYTLGRPGYAPALIQYLYSSNQNLKHSVVADIGSGTGKFARLLLEEGSEVYCVEPNSDMQRIAKQELRRYEKFHLVPGNAENTTLADHFVDYITVAQAFHWFDADTFRLESRRILRPGGKAFLIWNIRTACDPLNQALYRLFTEYCPNFRGFSNGFVQDDPRVVRYFGGSYDFVSFDYRLYYDREKFLARCLSSSYSLKPGDENYDCYIHALHSLFENFKKGSIVTMENQSTAYIGTV